MVIIRYHLNIIVRHHRQPSVRHVLVVDLIISVINSTNRQRTIIITPMRRSNKYVATATCIVFCVLCFVCRLTSRFSFLEFSKNCVSLSAMYIFQYQNISNNLCAIQLPMKLLKHFDGQINVKQYGMSHFCKKFNRR